MQTLALCHVQSFQNKKANQIKASSFHLELNSLAAKVPHVLHGPGQKIANSEVLKRQVCEYSTVYIIYLYTNNVYRIYIYI